MKRIILVTIMFLFASYVAAEESTIQDTTENRIAETNRYLSVMPPENLWIDMLEKIAAQLPADKRKRFFELMQKNTDINQVVDIMRDSMVKHFTAGEIHALADFYISPLGKSSMVKFGDYMADVLLKIQPYVTNIVKKTQSEMKE
jgi:hypothetical protein